MTNMPPLVIQAFERLDAAKLLGDQERIAYEFKRAWDLFRVAHNWELANADLEDGNE